MNSTNRLSTAQVNGFAEHPSLMLRSLTTIAGTITALYSAVVPSLHLAGCTLQQIAGWFQLAAPYIKFIPVVGSAVLAGGAAINALADGYALWSLHKEKTRIVEARVAEESRVIECDDTRVAELRAQEEAIDKKISLVTRALLINLLFFCLGTALATAEALLVWTGFPIVGIVLSALFMAGTAFRLYLLQQAANLQPATAENRKEIDFAFTNIGETLPGFLLSVQLEIGGSFSAGNRKNHLLRSAIRAAFDDRFNELLNGLERELRGVCPFVQPTGERPFDQLQPDYDAASLYIEQIKRNIDELTFISLDKKNLCKNRVDAVHQEFKQTFHPEVTKCINYTKTKALFLLGPRDEDDLAEISKAYRSAKLLMTSARKWIQNCQWFNAGEKESYGTQIDQVHQTIAVSFSEKMFGAITSLDDTIRRRLDSIGVGEVLAPLVILRRVTSAQRLISLGKTEIEQSHCDQIQKSGFSEKLEAIEEKNKDVIRKKVSEAINAFHKEISSQVAAINFAEGSPSLLLQKVVSVQQQISDVKGEIQQLICGQQEKTAYEEQINQLEQLLKSSLEGQLPSAIDRLSDEIVSEQVPGGEPSIEEIVSADVSAKKRILRATQAIDAFEFLTIEQKTDYKERVKCIRLTIKKSLHPQLETALIRFAEETRSLLDNNPEIYRMAPIYISAQENFSRTAQQIDQFDFLSEEEKNALKLQVTAAQDSLELRFNAMLSDAESAFHATTVEIFSTGPAAIASAAYQNAKVALDNARQSINQSEAVSDRQKAHWNARIRAIKSRLVQPFIEQYLLSFKPVCQQFRTAVNQAADETATLHEILGAYGDARRAIKEGHELLAPPSSRFEVAISKDVKEVGLDQLTILQEELTAHIIGDKARVVTILNALDQEIQQSISESRTTGNLPEINQAYRAAKAKVDQLLSDDKSPIPTGIAAQIDAQLRGILSKVITSLSQVTSEGHRFLGLYDDLFNAMRDLFALFGATESTPYCFTGSDDHQYKVWHGAGDKLFISATAESGETVETSIEEGVYFAMEPDQLSVVREALTAKVQQTQKQQPIASLLGVIQNYLINSNVRSPETRIISGISFSMAHHAEKDPAYSLLHLREQGHHLVIRLCSGGKAVYSLIYNSGNEKQSIDQLDPNAVLFLKRAVKAFIATCVFSREHGKAYIHEDAIVAFPRETLNYIVPAEVRWFAFRDDGLRETPGVDEGGLTRQVFSALARSLFDLKNPEAIKMNNGIPLQQSREDEAVLNDIGQLFIKVFQSEKNCLGSIFSNDFFDGLFAALNDKSKIDIVRAIRLDKKYLRICKIENQGRFSDEDTKWFNANFPTYSEFCRIYSNPSLTPQDRALLRACNKNPQTNDEIQRSAMEVIKSMFQDDPYIRLFRIYDRGEMDEDDKAWISKVELVEINENETPQQYVERLLLKEFKLKTEVDAISTIARSMQSCGRETCAGISSPERLRDKIQGELLTAAELFKRIVFSEETQEVLEKQQWIEEYLMTLDPEGVQRFIHLVTASPRLKPGQKIVITWVVGNRCQAHTCSGVLEVPRGRSTFGTPESRWKSSTEKELFMNCFLKLYESEAFGTR